MKVNILILISLFSWAQTIGASEEDQVLSKFKEYLELRYSLRESTPDKLKGVITRSAEVKTEILEFGDQGIEVLLGEMISNPSPRRKRDVIRFLDQSNLSNDRILSTVRSLVRAQKMDDLNPSVLVHSLEYLGNHGTQEDIELLESFNAHNSQGIPMFVKLATQKIEKRERGEKPDKSSGSPPEAISNTVQPAPEPTFATKTPKADKKPAESDSSSFPYWIFIIGGVVVVGLVVLLKNKGT